MLSSCQFKEPVVFLQSEIAQAAHVTHTSSAVKDYKVFSETIYLTYGISGSVQKC